MRYLLLLSVLIAGCATTPPKKPRRDPDLLPSGPMKCRTWYVNGIKHQDCDDQE